MQAPHLRQLSHYAESYDRPAPVKTAADFAEYNIDIERVVGYGK